MIMKRQINRVRHHLNASVVRYRVMRDQARLMPDFIIIGAQRCGTTYLYDKLSKHPNIIPALKKEIHFFDVNFSKGIAWYQAHFPAHNAGQNGERQNFAIGEASPYYLFHPLAPRRISKLIPQVKLIAIFRNPTDRAYSQYHQQVRKGFETLSFEDAIHKEKERLSGEAEKMLEDENYDSFAHRHHSYLSRGIYVDQLISWSGFFPKEQLLILKSEDLYKDTSSAIQQITDFLGLPSWKPAEYKKPASSPYPKMNVDARNYLIDFFKPHNQRLYDYLGVDFGWDR
jgi:hypothetical protein